MDSSWMNTLKDPLNKSTTIDLLQGKILLIKEPTTRQVYLGTIELKWFVEKDCLEPLGGDGR